MREPAATDGTDLEELETREWFDSLDYVFQSGGPARVGRLLNRLSDHARCSGVRSEFTANTPYINTILDSEQPQFPGSREIERRIRSLVRWNAMAMVVKANRIEEGIGGHISTYASAATLYEVGFNHFFKGKGDEHDGDIIYFQGHAAPGIYARAFLEGRIGVDQLTNFRRELSEGGGLHVVPAPMADARVLGVSDGLDGSRADLRHLSGALHALPGGSRTQEALQCKSMGLSGRRRDGRARIARRDHVGLSRETRQI